MTLTDQLGNPLFTGDFVLMADEDGVRLFGLIGEIHEGGIIAPGKEQMQMTGSVQLIWIPTTMSFDPHVPRLMNITKVVKPPQMQSPKPPAAKA